jgi:hypothetical protein
MYSYIKKHTYKQTRGISVIDNSNDFICTEQSIIYGDIFVWPTDRPHCRTDEMKYCLGGGGGVIGCVKNGIGVGDRSI